MGGRASAQNRSLFFKDNQSAFEYSCKYGDCNLQIGRAFLALVLDSPPITVRDDGVQSCHLRVASAEGGFEVFAQTLSAKGPKLEPGMLVVWQYHAGMPRFSAGALAPFGRIGFIAAVLHPELDIEKGWKIHALFEQEDQGAKTNNDIDDTLFKRIGLLLIIISLLVFIANLFTSRPSYHNYDEIAYTAICGAFVGFFFYKGFIDKLYNWIKTGTYKN